MSRDEYKGYYDDVYDELYHYGIKGQKWGIRRYQNPDGSLTEEGRRRYGHLGSQEEIDAAIKRDTNYINSEKNIAKKYKRKDARTERKYKKLQKWMDENIDPNVGIKNYSESEQKKIQKWVRAMSDQVDLDERIQFSMDRLNDMTIDEINKEKKQKVGSRAVLGEMIAGPLLAGGMALYAKDNPYSFRRDERDWNDYKENYDFDSDPKNPWESYKRTKNFTFGDEPNKIKYESREFKDKNRSAKAEDEYWESYSKAIDKWEKSPEGKKLIDKWYKEAASQGNSRNMTKSEYMNTDLYWNDYGNYFDDHKDELRKYMQST